MQTVADLLALPGLSNTQISPDGAWVVYEQHPAVSDPDSGRHLWGVSTDGGQPRQLTAGSGKESNPAWSPDGQQLAFLSDREGQEKRLHLLPWAGGDAQVLDTGAGAIKEFAWSPDGTTIAFLRKDPLPGDQQESKTAPIVVEEAPRFDRLWLLTLATGAVSPLFSEAVHIWEFAWFADGTGLAVVAASEPTEAAWYTCWLARLDCASGQLTTLYQPAMGRQVARPAPAPDGTTVAVISCRWSDPGMSGGDLLLVSTAATGQEQPRNLTSGADFSVNSAVWLPDGDHLLCDTYSALGASIGTVAASGQEGWRELWHGPYSLSFGGLHTTADGSAFAVPRSAINDPAAVWLGQVTATAVQWHRLAPAQPLAGFPLDLTTHEVSWAAPDGQQISGLLILPSAAEEPFPVVTLVHGGPTGRAAHGFASRGFAALAPLLAARGIATFMPNFRGSNGRGVAFAEANHGDMGGMDWVDVNTGVDQLVASGVADPARLAIGGWSYGGFMTMWGITQTTRFKAAVAGAGIANWASFHGTSSLHVWDALFYEADPYDPQSIYLKRSPVFSTHQVVTPTLVLHGDADRVVPPDQGREFFRALKDRQVDTQLVLYPGAGHGPQHPDHITDVLTRSLDWFTQRLLD